MLRAVLNDKFVWLLLATIALATLLPAQGDAARWLGLLSQAGIFLLFFLNGVRLPRAEVVEGLANWRVQGSLWLFVFVAMGAAGLAIWSVARGWLPPEIALGILFLGVLPTTVQSAAAYSSLAGGNMATSVIAAAQLNLTGIVATPLLFALLAGGHGAGLSTDSLIRICLILLLPFSLGQLAQHWLRDWVLALAKWLTMLDRAIIALAVFIAFSGAVIAGIWRTVEPETFLIIGVSLAALLAFGFGGALLLGRALGVDDRTRRSVLFSGAHKSIAIGAPLAAILFPPDTAGMVLVPVLGYHISQLMLSGPIAAHYRAIDHQRETVTAPQHTA